MPGDRTVQQIRQARAELRNLNRDLDRFADRAREAGDRGGSSFGKKFKAAAVAGIKEMAKAAAAQLGASLVQRFFERGEAGGRGFGRGFKRAAKKEIETGAAEIAPSGGGGAMSGIWKGVAISAAVVGLAAGKTLIASVKEAMGQESLTMSLEALQPGRGGGLFEAFRADALRTGVAIEDMAGNVRKFLALGFDETGAMKLNRAILDVAGGMGLTQEDAKGLGMALAQIAAKGTAAMEELRGQIAERGVPIFELLAGKLTAGDQGELMKMIAAGKVGADAVIESFSNMEGPLAKFAGGADRLGQTGAGMIARIKQELLDLLRVGGEAILPELKPVLDDAIGLIQRLKADAAGFGERLAEGLGLVRATMQELSMGEIFQLAGLGLKNAFMSALDTLSRGLWAIVNSFTRADFRSGIEKQLKDAAVSFKVELLRGLADVFNSMALLPGRGVFGWAANDMTKAAAEAERKQARDKRYEKFFEGIGVGKVDPVAILKEEFAKATSIFGLSEKDQAQMNALLGRIKSRRASDLAAREDGGTGAPPAPGSPAPTPEKAPFDPRAVIGGGIANALSLIGGGGSTVILQKQVDLLGKLAGSQKKSETLLKEIRDNTKPQTPRGPIKQRPAFT